MRLDVYLFEKEYAKSRQSAKSLILDGNVSVDGVIVNKPAFDINENDAHNIEILNACPYVSRGGLKLEKLLRLTSTDVTDKICIDIGASTGGFTHCLLLNGAKRVYAIDSGTGQLANELRCDPRVISLENFNARSLTPDDIGENADIVTIDVSFISQTLIIPSICKVMSENGKFLSLIKPQFEAGRENIGKGGIVKSKKARLDAVLKVISCARDNSLVCTELAESPIHGGDGNVEYICLFTRNGRELDIKSIKKIVLE